VKDTSGVIQLDHVQETIEYEALVPGWRSVWQILVPIAPIRGLNVHFHFLGLDGVYVRDKASGRLTFHALGTPTRAEVADVVARTATRIEKILNKAGRPLDPEMQGGEPPELCEKELGLAACYTAAAQGVSVSGDRAGLPPLRMVVSVDPKPATDDPSDPVAEVRGVNVHARQIVDGRDRISSEGQAWTRGNRGSHCAGRHEHDRRINSSPSILDDRGGRWRGGGTNGAACINR
jgi:hypothetical protein